MSPSDKWTERRTWIFNNLGFTKVVLSSIQGYKDFKELDFLKDLKNLKSLYIEAPDKSVNITAVEACINLESFSLVGKAKPKIDFTRLPYLKEAYVEYNQNFSTILGCHNLRKLTLIDYDGIDLRPLSGLKSLENLTLLSPKKMQSLDGMEELTAIRLVEIEDATSLANIQAYSDIDHKILLRIDGNKIYRQKDLTDEEAAVVVEKFGKKRLDRYWSQETNF